MFLLSVQAIPRSGSTGLTPKTAFLGMWSQCSLRETPAGLGGEGYTSGGRVPAPVAGEGGGGLTRPKNILLLSTLDQVYSGAYDQIVDNVLHQCSNNLRLWSHPTLPAYFYASLSKICEKNLILTAASLFHVLVANNDKCSQFRAQPLVRLASLVLLSACVQVGAADTVKSAQQASLFDDTLSNLYVF